MVSFKDGRIKAFRHFSGVVFQIGRTNVVSFSNSQEIISVKVED